MIFPSYLTSHDVIGITAPSAGIPPEYQEGLELSESHFRQNGFEVRETENVRAPGVVSSDGETRAKQLHDLFRDPEVKLILSAAGGDFLIDMLPYVDFDLIRSCPKWVQGYSDPTNLLYAMTTTCDIATIYGTNGGGFDVAQLMPYLQSSIDLWQGKVQTQHSYVAYEGEKNMADGTKIFDKPVYWKTPNGSFSVQGRLLGGCVDCLCDIIGTPYDGTNQFIQKYQADGVIWYFDIFALRAEAVHNTLWNMREAGWFENARAFVFGRVLIPSSFFDMSYEEAIVRVLGEKVPIALEADVGHVPPRMTMINGMLSQLDVAHGKAELKFLNA